MPNANHWTGVSTLKPSGALGNSTIEESYEQPPVKSSAADSCIVHTRPSFHESASDLDISPSTAGAGAGSDALITKGPGDGVTRTYSDDLLGRKSGDLSRAVQPISPSRLEPGNTPQRKTKRLQKVIPNLTVAQYEISHSHTNEELTELPKALAKKSREIVTEDPNASEAPHLLRRNGSWILPSRSPHPRNTIIGKDATTSHITNGNRQSIFGSSEIHQRTENADRSPFLARRASSSSFKNRRLSSLLSRTKSVHGDEPPIKTSSSASSSTDRITLREHNDGVPSMPNLASRDRYLNAGLEIQRKKDELGSIFRSLESDYQKFMSKPSTLKANIVRNSLLPFLRNYAEHPSCRRLRPEDLDRRVNVLNKWWAGLLEMVSGRTGHSVSASDRPFFLEAIAAITTRPEWIAAVSAIASQSNRSHTTIVSQSSTSVDSNTSDFLAESVISNVRNIFSQNLLAQMAYVVESMSSRSTPASVVTFCGKITAYAFFFCPGVAEILLRLWDLPADAFRRVLNENGLSRSACLHESAASVARMFPPHLRALTFTSMPRLRRHLQNQGALPLGLDIDWDGPWKTRWSGKETDLFFCFAKYFHILLYNIIPNSATIEQQLCAPGVLMVHAQLMTVMDTTIRGTTQDEHQEPSNGPLNTTFDDVLGPDTPAEPLPGRSRKPTRSMAENRLVMLLRDFLSPAPEISDAARRSFATAFDTLLKAVTKRISPYNPNACFSLCDFLEEVIVIQSRYYRNKEDPGAFLDWDFWLPVLRKMGESQNSTTDIRLYAFLYSLWSYIAKDAVRKRVVCLEWLLQEPYATRQLCHWCPMVRAYFMRLLCWRVVRFDGSLANHDVEIFKVAHQRLRDVWDHFRFLQNQAMEQHMPLLATTAMNPVPQRRFMIIRDDSAPTAAGFLSFDTMIAMTSTNGGLSSLEPLRQLRSDIEEPAPAKKRWSSLKGLNPFTSPSAMASSLQTTAAAANSSTKNRESRQLTPSPPESPTSGSPTSACPSHSFKFSLEYVANSSPPARRLFPPLLPPPAQRCLQTKYPAPPPTCPRQPGPGLIQSGKYAGRAIAEWIGLVDEWRSFHERRRQEGVPDLAMVEVPTLSIESFRRPVG